jgi:hypothetical protein
MGHCFCHCWSRFLDYLCCYSCGCRTQLIVQFKKLKYWAILLFLLSWMAYLFFFNPESADGIYPKCIVKATTGLDCPGCGSSRCAYDIVHLDFWAAFKHNPLAFIAIPSLIIYAVGGIFNVNFERLFGFIPDKFRSNFSSILLVVVVIFTLLRNVL